MSMSWVRGEVVAYRDTGPWQVSLPPVLDRARALPLKLSVLRACRNLSSNSWSGNGSDGYLLRKRSQEH